MQNRISRVALKKVLNIQPQNNLILKLDADLYETLERIATQRDISILVLICETLKEFVEEDGYVATRTRAMVRLGRGFELGTQNKLEGFRRWPSRTSQLMPTF